MHILYNHVKYVFKETREELTWIWQKIKMLVGFKYMQA